MADLDFEVNGSYPPFMVVLLDSNDNIVPADDGGEGYLIQDSGNGETYSGIASGTYRLRSYDASQGFDEFEITVS